MAVSSLSPEPSVNATEHRALPEDHGPEDIRRRLQQPSRRSYLGDAVLGGIDGCVTTFAIVAGSIGAGLSGLVALVLGLANLLADGFSMAVSNYQARRAERELLERARRMERRHIQVVPDGEREEVRQIFAAKGFSGDTLEQIVDTITADHELWIATMVAEEHGLDQNPPEPWRSGAATFAAFIGVGAVPLLPLALLWLPTLQRFYISIALAALMFLAIGMVKGRATEHPVWRSGLSTLVTGGVAAGLAFGVAFGLRAAFGV